MSAKQGRTLVAVAAIVVILAGLKAAGGLLAPIVFAAMIAAVSAPGASWLARRGVPALFGALIVLVLDIGVLSLFGRLLYLAAGDVERRLPVYLDQFSTMMASVSHTLTRVPTAVGRARIATEHADRLGQFLTDLAGHAANVASDTVVVLFVVFFFLWELAGISAKFRADSANATEQLARVDRIVREIQKYLLVKTLTSTLAALMVYAVLRLAHVELALFLALLLFVLHFIPNVGAAIAMVPAVLVALADRGAGTAVAVTAAYLTTNALVGSVLEPKLLGRTLGLSALFVLLGMLFWGFIWGPLGALLSVPLLMIGKIIIENTPELAWLSHWLEPTPVRSLLRTPKSAPNVGLGGGLERASQAPPP